QAELDAAIAHRDRGVVAVDLAGVEEIGPGPLFVQHYRQAREAGLRITAHAGEWSGVESVRQAVLELGAERLGHAVAAARDPAAMDLIAEQGIAIESCPTSNVQFSAVSSYQAHPLPVFLRRGLLVTVNTDDPGISGIDLPHEYRILRQEMDLTEDQVRQVQANGVKAAFLSDEERAALWQDKQAQ
ncbi:MAG: adenosine deaminase, partial [Chloroflexi bacterium]|nr:adenosine deaminase [Chloroflexota bacterium]